MDLNFLPNLLKAYNEVNKVPAASPPTTCAGAEVHYHYHYRLQFHSYFSLKEGQGSILTFLYRKAMGALLLFCIGQPGEHS